MTCKGICSRHKAQRPKNGVRYAAGQKRCQICEIFLKWDSMWCPCCGYRLRGKPRNTHYKGLVRAAERIRSGKDIIDEAYEEMEEEEFETVEKITVILNGDGTATRQNSAGELGETITL